MKSFLIKSLFLVLIISVKVHAQTQDLGKLTNPVPPSPTTREFEKYMDHQVSIQNGIPDIEIPLYEIKISGVTIPISLRYHASGIKDKQTNGDIGVGWSLTPNYRVSRTVYGRRDEDYEMPASIQDPYTITDPATRDKYLSRFGLPETGSSGTLPTPSGSWLDGEYDLFSYSLLSTSGNFLIKNRQNKEVAMLDGDHSRISYQVTDNVGSGINRIDFFDVTDTNGLKYRMGTTFKNEIYGLEYAPGGKGVSGWVMTGLVTLFNDTVHLQYEQRLEENTQSTTTAVFQEAEGPFIHEGTCITDGFLGDTNGSTLYTVPFLQVINTPNETITFSRSTPSPTPPYDNKIQAMEVRDKAGVLIKRIEFTYSSSPSVNNYIYRYLDKISIYGRNLSEAPQIYSFDYHKFTGSTPLVYDVDYWGYLYKTTGLGLPIEAGDYGVYTVFNSSSCYPSPSTLRQASNKNGIPLLFGTKQITEVPHFNSLYQITYPTGGRTVFQYESNQYLNSNGEPEKGGGIRIGTITDYDQSATTSKPSLVRNYKYGSNENGNGITALAPKYQLFGNERMNFRLMESTISVSTRNIDLSTLPMSEAFSDAASHNPVHYPEVSVYYSGTNAVNGNGRERYLYESAFGNAYEPFRTNKIMRLGQYGRETLTITSRTFTPYIIRGHDFTKKQPNLLSKEIYDKNGNVIQKESYSYKVIVNSQSFQGLKVKPFAADQNGTALNFYTMYNLESFFDFSPYVISGGNNLLTKAITTSYNNNVAGVSVVKEYTYNNASQVIKETVTDSRNNVQIVTYKHPLDYKNLTSSDTVTAGIKRLQELNILGPVIEKSAWKEYQENKRLLSSQFQVYYPSVPLPKEILTTELAEPLTDFDTSFVDNGSVVMDSRYRHQVKFDLYDYKGNILQQRKQNDISSTYLWDYKNQYPVAQVTNAQLKDVAYTSFESDGKGGWAFMGIPTSDATSPTGKKAYAMSTANVINKTGLDANKEYILSYWYKSDCIQVSGGTQHDIQVSPADAEGWFFTQRKITGTSTIVLTGNGCYVDELRLYPASSQMITYTYDLLIGMTSMTDMNNVSTYYEYDSLGRLFLIKDKNRDILKKVEYHYTEAR